MPRKIRRIIPLILIMTLCLLIIFPVAAYAGPTETILNSVAHVVERGVGWLIIAVATGIVMILEALGLSLVGIISQGALGPNPIPQGVSLISVTVPDASGKIDCLFNTVINIYYPVAYKVAIITFLIILSYIGVQAILSTAASKRAEYMGKISAWGFGILMLFAFNYVIIYTVKANNALANFFLTIGGVTYTASGQAPTPGTAPTELPEEKNLLTYINAHRQSHTELDKTSTHTVNGATFTITENWAKTNYPNFDGGYVYRIIGGTYLTAPGSPAPTPSEADKYALYFRPIPDTTPSTNELLTSGTYEPYKDKPLANIGYIVKFGNGSITSTLNYDQLKARVVFLKSKALFEYNNGGFRLSRRAITSDDIYKICDASFMSTNMDEFDGGIAKGLDVAYVPPAAQKSDESIFTPTDPLLKEFFDAWHNSKDNMGGIMGALIYLGMAVMMGWLFVVYLIRMLFISFLILLFPIVMAVYCIDRLDDNKSKVFHEWWNHFLSHVFTNSIHALTLGIIYKAILYGGPSIPPLVKLITLFAFFPANKLAREIFGLGRGGSADMGGMAAMGAGMMMLNKGGGSGGGGKAPKAGGGGDSSGGDSGGGDSSGDGGGSTYSRLSNKWSGYKENVTNAKSNAKGKGFKGALGVAGAAAKPFGKLAGRAALSAGKKGLRATGVAVGATAMLATGQGLNSAIGAGYMMSRMTGSGVDKLIEGGQGVGNFASDAMAHKRISDATKAEDGDTNGRDIDKLAFGDGFAYYGNDSSSPDGKKYLHFEKNDNSSLTSTEFDRNKSFDDQMKSAAYGLSYKTDGQGRIKDGSVSIHNDSIDKKATAMFQPRRAACDKARTALNNNFTDPGKKAEFERLDLRSEAGYKKGMQMFNDIGRNQNEVTKQRNLDKACDRDESAAKQKWSQEAANHDRKHLSRTDPYSQKNRPTYSNSYYAGE